MVDIFSIAASLGVAAMAAMSVAVGASSIAFKTRHFDSVTAKIETDAIMKIFPEHSQLSCSEIHVPHIGWVSRYVVSRHFCATLKVNSSPTDLHLQTFEITIWRLWCLSWRGFEEMLRPLEPGRQDVSVVGLPMFLDHLVQSSASHSYPDFTVQSKCAHPPDSTEEELTQSDAIARRAINQLNANGSGVFLVRGKPMTGKTGAGMRMAQILGAVVCTRFSPFRAGNMVTQLTKARSEHRPNSPLIIFLDEIDVKLDALGTLPLNPKLLTEVTDKDSWNDWVDDISRCQNVVLWLTSNADNAKMGSYDPSLLREKRVTAHYNATCSNEFDVVHEQDRLPVHLMMDRSLMVPPEQIMDHESRPVGSLRTRLLP